MSVELEKLVCINRTALAVGDRMRLIYEGGGGSSLTLEIIVCSVASLAGLVQRLQITGNEFALRLMEGQRANPAGPPHTGYPHVLADLSGRYIVGSELETGFNGAAVRIPWPGFVLKKVETLTVSGKRVAKP